MGSTSLSDRFLLANSLYGVVPVQLGFNRQPGVGRTRALGEAESIFYNVNECEINEANGMPMCVSSFVENPKRNL